MAASLLNLRSRRGAAGLRAGLGSLPDLASDPDSAVGPLCGLELVPSLLRAPGCLLGKMWIELGPSFQGYGIYRDDVGARDEELHVCWRSQLGFLPQGLVLVERQGLLNPMPQREEPE